MVRTSYHSTYILYLFSHLWLPHTLSYLIMWLAWALCNIHCTVHCTTFITLYIVQHASHCFWACETKFIYPEAITVVLTRFCTQHLLQEQVIWKTKDVYVLSMGVKTTGSLDLHDSQDVDLYVYNGNWFCQHFRRNLTLRQKNFGFWIIYEYVFFVNSKCLVVIIIFFVISFNILYLMKIKTWTCNVHWWSNKLASLYTLIQLVFL